MTGIRELKSAFSSIKKEKRVFVSHSSADNETIDKIVAIFDGTKVKPVRMEYERWSMNNEATWDWIRRNIESSVAILVVLTKGIVSKAHTQNWVAFEIGIAAECKPPKPVIVLKQEELDFPVPYLNYYLPYPIMNFYDYPTTISKMKRVLANLNDVDNELYLLVYHLLAVMLMVFPDKVSRFEAKNPDSHSLRCNECKVSFVYFGAEDNFPCPCCGTTVDNPLRLDTDT